MKKPLTLFLVFFISWLYPAANPIMLESLFLEVYFEDEKWFLVIDNYMLDPTDYTFEGIYITCNDGPLYIKDDFLPDPTQSITILSNECLYTPVEIPRAGDSIHSYMDNSWGYFEFTTLVWNDTLPSPVCGPLEGQSLVITMVYKTFEITEWWLVKNDLSTWNHHGSFAGYVLDLYNNPVADALIHYIDDEYIDNPYNQFDALWTNDLGYFEIDDLPARNYTVSKISKDSQSFFPNEIISIEPGENYHEFTIDYIVGTGDKAHQKGTQVTNFPNPFERTTIFEIDLEPGRSVSQAYLKILDLNGRTVSIKPLPINYQNPGKLSFNWTKPGHLASGEYLYVLCLDGKYEAQGKMIITP